MSEKVDGSDGSGRDYEVYSVPSEWGEQDPSLLAGMLERMRSGLNYRDAYFLSVNGWYEVTSDAEETQEVHSEPTFTLLAVRQAVLSVISDKFPDEPVQPAVVRRSESPEAYPSVGLLPEDQELGSILLSSEREGDEVESVRDAVPALTLDNEIAPGEVLTDEDWRMLRTVITVSPPDNPVYARLGLLVGQSYFILPGLQHGAAQGLKLTSHVREWARVSGTPIL